VQLSHARAEENCLTFKEKYFEAESRAEVSQKLSDCLQQDMNALRFEFDSISSINHDLKNHLTKLVIYYCSKFHDVDKTYFYSIM
jgi:hypothetical protein